MTDCQKPYLTARAALLQINELLSDRDHRLGELQQRCDRRVQKLEDRIAELEELLGLRETVDIPVIQCRSKRRVHIVLKLLAARELVSTTAVRLAIGGEDLADSTAKIYVHYARASLKPFKIKVRCDVGRGWYIDAFEKPRLRTILRGEFALQRVAE